MPRSLHIGFWSLLLLLAPVGAQAEGNVISAFNRSVTRLYVASEKCRETSAHSVEYLAMLDSYLKQKYPNGIPYWVVPEVKEQILSRQACNLALLDRVMQYQTASQAYADHYPDLLQPPIVVAYVTESGNYSGYRSLNLVRRLAR